MKLLTPKECADRAHVSVSLIYAVLQRKKLPALRVGVNGKGKWLVAEEEFDNWLQSMKVSETASDEDLKYLN